jgi:hypothetical protein
MIAEQITLQGPVSHIHVQGARNMKLTIRGRRDSESPTVAIPKLLDIDDTHVQTPRPRFAHRPDRGLLVVRTALPASITAFWQGGIPERDPAPNRPAECVITLPREEHLGGLAVTATNVRLALEDLEIDTMFVDRLTSPAGPDTERSLGELAMFVMHGVALHGPSYVHLAGNSSVALNGVTGAGDGKLVVVAHEGRVVKDSATTVPLMVGQPGPGEREHDPVCQLVLSEGAQPGPLYT